MKLHKNATMHSIIDGATNTAAEYGKWPDVPARGEIADREIGYFREMLRGNDPALLRALILYAISQYLDCAHNLDTDLKPEQLKRGLIKLMDAIFMQEEK